MNSDSQAGHVVDGLESRLYVAVFVDGSGEGNLASILGVEFHSLVVPSRQYPHEFFQRTVVEHE